MKVCTPHNLKEVPLFMKEHPEAKFLAGGTDLLRKAEDKDLLIDLSRLQEQLNGIKADSDRLGIGALVTFSKLAVSSEVEQVIPALSMAAREMGSVQIRNRATLGGNIANASPAADSLPPLLAHKSWLKVMGEDGESRELNLNDYLEQKQNHLILQVIVPKVRGKSKFSYFQKIGTRKKVSIARLNAGVWADYNQQEKEINEIRIVLGALAIKPFRVRRAERVVKGKKIDKFAKKKFLDRLTEAVDRAIPGRYSQPYKRIAIRGLGEDIISALEMEVLS